MTVLQPERWRPTFPFLSSLCLPPQAHAEELREGQRVPAAEESNHSQDFLELRLRARAVALHFIQGGWVGGCWVG